MKNPALDSWDVGFLFAGPYWVCGLRTVLELSVERASREADESHWGNHWESLGTRLRQKDVRRVKISVRSGECSQKRSLALPKGPAAPQGAAKGPCPK